MDTNRTLHIFRNDSLPSITALKFDGPLRMGVGTSTGHVLLYDIRSSKPLLVKDHMNEIPIKFLEFHKQMDYVYSMDSSVVKIWNKNTVSIKTPTVKTLFNCKLSHQHWDDFS